MGKCEDHLIKELEKIIKQLERFETLNKEDMPTVINVLNARLRNLKGEKDE